MTFGPLDAQSLSSLLAGRPTPTFRTACPVSVIFHISRSLLKTLKQYLTRCFFFIVMYRIVDDPMPPIPEEWSTTLKDFLKQCFQRNPTDRPSAEALSEHDWLKEHCEVHRVLRPKDSVPFLRRVSQELQRPPDAVRFVSAEGPRSDSRASVDPPRKSEERSASPIISGLPSSLPNPRLSTGPATPKSPESEVPLFREHSFVKTAFGKRELISQAI